MANHDKPSDPAAQSPTQSSANASATTAGTGPAQPEGRTPRATATLGGNDLLFETLKGAFYHEIRESYFIGWHKRLMFLIALSGTAAASTVLSNYATLAPYIGILITILGLVDLVFDVSGKAREHGYLRKRFMELYGDCHGDPLDESGLNRRLFALYAEEPPQYRAVNAVAYNLARRTLFDDKEERRLVISKPQRLLKNWWRFGGADFNRKSEANRRSLIRRIFGEWQHGKEGSEEAGKKGG